MRAQIYLYEFAVKLCQSVAVRFQMITYDDLLPMILVVIKPFRSTNTSSRMEFFFRSIFFFLRFRTVYAKDKKKIHVNIEKKLSSYFILSVVKNEVRIKFYVHPKKRVEKREKK